MRPSRLLKNIQRPTPSRRGQSTFLHGPHDDWYEKASPARFWSVRATDSRNPLGAHATCSPNLSRSALIALETIGRRAASKVAAATTGPVVRPAIRSAPRHEYVAVA